MKLRKIDPNKFGCIYGLDQSIHEICCGCHLFDDCDLRMDRGGSVNYFIKALIIGAAIALVILMK